MSMQNQEMSDIVKKSESGNTEMFGTISQLSQIKKEPESWPFMGDKPITIRKKAHGNKTGGTTTPKDILALAPQEEIKSTFSYQVKNQINNFSDNNSFRK